VADLIALSGVWVPVWHILVCLSGGHLDPILGRVLYSVCEQSALDHHYICHWKAVSIHLVGGHCHCHYWIIGCWIGLSLSLDVGLDLLCTLMSSGKD